MVGKIVGHYRIESRIGEGHFAVVYKGRDLRLGRAVAVKVLKEKGLQGNATWGCLLREARVGSTMNHPNICMVYDIGEDEDLNYIVFELVEGRTLHAILESGPLPAKTCLIYAMEVAEAIAHANSAGILHLDLKSSNIMVTTDGRVKVIDFGLVRIMHEKRANQSSSYQSSAHEIGWLTGTLPYMAPEVLHGEPPSREAGAWSLGVTLFEMLTGQLPFAGRTPFELGMDIMIGSIDRLPAEIPRSLRAIVQRCLARDKGLRYLSAAEVLRDLRSEFTAMEVTAIAPGWSPSKSQPHWRGLLQSVLTSLLLLLYGG